MQSEGVVSSFGYVGFTLQVTPAVIIPEPNQFAFAISHLMRNADFIAVEVVGLLDAFSVFGCPIANLCQGLVVVGIGVDIGISAVPNKSSFLFEAVFVVDEAGKGKRIGQGRLKVISDNLDILLGLDPTYAC